MKTLMAVMLIYLISAPVTALAQSDRSFVYDKTILLLLGKVEGPDGYDDITGHATIAPPRPLSSMTISEVLDYQKQLRSAGNDSSAVGKYQFIWKTLNFLVDRHRIDPQQKFDGRTQDFLARMLLNDCDYYSPHASETAIGNCLARTWAAFPVMTGEKAGRSYYHGKAGNKAQTSVRVVQAVIAQRFTRPIEIRRPPVEMASAITWPDDGRYADKVPLR